VSHYVGGIADWRAAGLPVEGHAAGEPTIGTLARQDVPTCGPEETLAEVRQRVRAAGWDTCFVVNERGIVLGRLHPSDLEGDDRAPAEEAMRPGPSTYRADVPIDQMLDVMQQEEIRTAPVTRPDGSLIGLVLREDLERVASTGSAGGAQRAE
jgi:CBS domain-containing protein